MTSGRSRGWHRQVLNEEVPYHESNIQDMMIEDLQRQVMQLIPRLAMRNMELHCDIDNRDLESNFENLYHNHVIVQEQRV